MPTLLILAISLTIMVLSVGYACFMFCENTSQIHAEVSLMHFTGYKIML